MNTQTRRTCKRLDFDAINSAALNHLQAILARWLPDGRVVGGEFIARNPTRNDQRPGSFKIRLRDCRWCDFAVGAKGGDVVSLAAYLHNLSQGEAACKLAAMLGVRADG